MDLTQGYNLFLDPHTDVPVRLIPIPSKPLMNMKPYEHLVERQRRFLHSHRGVRKPELKDVFERLCYIAPSDLIVSNYIRSKPLVAFNPGALLVGKRLRVFPRLIFDYYKYVSSIGVFELDIESVLNGDVPKPIETRIVLWPQSIWEFLGVEDPRTLLRDGEVYVLYTGKGYYLGRLSPSDYVTQLSRLLGRTSLRDASVEPFEELLNQVYMYGRFKRRDVLGLAILDETYEVKRRLYFRIRFGDEFLLPRSNKDSAFVNMNVDECTILTRPEVDGLNICWRCKASLHDGVIIGETLQPVLGFENWELKIGWSTNTVKVSSNEYLVGWHAVLKDDLSYRNGLALVDETGRLLALSNYLLASKGLVETYGDRILVIFGDGLLVYQDRLLWIGGVGDYAIGLFSTDLDEVFEELKWLTG